MVRVCLIQTTEGKPAQLAACLTFLSDLFPLCLDITPLYLSHHLEALRLHNMAEAPACTSSEDGLPVQWKCSSRRSRKPGCSNIFTGVNLHQLHRLFRTAGDRDAEHRAKLVWRGMDADTEAAEEAKEEEGEEGEDEAGLAQALVGLRVRARTKAGIRAEGHRDQKWLKASGYLRIEEPVFGYSDEDEEANIAPSLGELLPATEEHIQENQSLFRPSSWRLDMARQECARHSERYLHRILH